jgi:hypothetical protein
MRGDDDQQEEYSATSPQRNVFQRTICGLIREMVDEILKEMSPQFAKCGRCKTRSSW